MGGRAYGRRADDSRPAATRTLLQPLGQQPGVHPGVRHRGVERVGDVDGRAGVRAEEKACDGGRRRAARGRQHAGPGDRVRDVDDDELEGGGGRREGAPGAGMGSAWRARRSTTTRCGGSHRVQGEREARGRHRGGRRGAREWRWPHLRPPMRRALAAPVFELIVIQVGAVL